MFGEFAHVDHMLAALDALSQEPTLKLETYTSFELPEVDEPLGLKRSHIGWIALAGGLVGLIASYGIQWWANVYSYPLNVGARPVQAVPAFLLATFEGTVLGAALATFAGLLIILRFPKLWAPEDEIDGFARATIDRFWISACATNSEPTLAHAERIMQETGALRTVRTYVSVPRSPQAHVPQVRTTQTYLAHTPPTPTHPTQPSDAPHEDVCDT
jgi:hypothetical protein